MPSGGTSSASSATLTASPQSAAGALRIVTCARPAIATSTRNSPYSAQPSATHGSASWAAKNFGVGEQPHQPAPEQHQAGDDQAGEQHVVGRDAGVDARRLRVVDSIEYASGGHAYWNARTVKTTIPASLTESE